MKKKYLLLKIFVALSFIRCGGGSGGSSGSPTPGVIPTINTPNLIDPVGNNKPGLGVPTNNNHFIDEKPTIGEISPPTVAEPRVKFNTKLPKTFSYETPKIPKTDLKTEDLAVGILDSDFVQNKEQLLKKYADADLKIIDNKEHSFTEHGEIVLNDLMRGIKSTVIATSIGKKNGDDNVIAFNLDYYKTILDEMKKKDKDGVKLLKVFNQSWGSGVDANEEAEFYKNGRLKKNDLLTGISSIDKGLMSDILASGRKSLEFYQNAIENENALFVWANGNLDSKDNTLLNAGVQAAAPSAVSALEKGWISVVGVDGKNLNNHYFPKHLAYAGIASNWSISADGNSDISDSYGSSYAAPKVSNAAIKVGSKFRWMTNNDVRITLFTTTNNIGVGDAVTEENRYLNSFADPKFGWGVLNTERALKGPGAFWQAIIKADSDNFDYDDYRWYFNAKIPENTKTYFENHIYGDTGLKKSGKGSLVLTNIYDNSADTKISEGSLEIYKTHRPGITIKKDGDLILHNDALVGYYEPDFGDMGATISKVINEGNITLTGKNAYIGKLENKSGSLNIKDGSCLNILTEGDLNNLTLNVMDSSYVSLKGKKDTLIKANSLSGEISHVNIDGRKNVKVENKNNTLIASINRESMLKNSENLTKGEKESLERVENTLKSLDVKYDSNLLKENEEKFGNSMLSLSKKENKNIASFTSAEVYASAQALAFLESQSINRTLSNHLMSLKDFSSRDYDWQGWISYFNSKGDLESSNYTEAKIKINGGEFGLDRKIGNTIYGVAFSFSDGLADFDRYAGKYKNESVGISLYSKKYFKNNIYILGKLGISNFDTKVERTILDSDGKLKAGKIDHNDQMLSSYFEFGKHYKYLTPFIGYSADYLKRDSFKENASWGIEADSKGYLKQNIILGINGEYEIKHGLKLFADITHQLNIGNRDLNFKGNFVGSNTQHTFKGIDLNKNTTWIGLGISKDINETLSINFKIDGKVEKKLSEKLFNIGITYRF